MPPCYTASVRDAITWLRSRALPASEPSRERRSMLIASPSDGSENDIVELLLEGRGAPERARIEIVTGDPMNAKNAAIALRDFDVVILAGEVALEAWTHTAQRAWARLRRETGLLLVALPFGPITPSGLVRILRTLVRPSELFTTAGIICFSGMR